MGIFARLINEAVESDENECEETMSEGFFGSVPDDQDLTNDIQKYLRRNGMDGLASVIRKAIGNRDANKFCEIIGKGNSNGTFH